MNHPLRRHAVLLLSVLIVPQLLAAQQRRPRTPLTTVLQNPVEALIQRADSLGLGLSPDQTARLEELRSGFDEATSPARAAIEAASGRAGGGAIRELRPQLQSIRGHNEAVLELVRAEVLSEEQWEIASAFLAPERPRGMSGAPRPGRR